jgi:hypothetical protein
VAQAAGTRSCAGLLEVFPTVRTNPLRAKSLFAAASPKSDLQITHRISLKTRFVRLIYHHNEQRFYHQARYYDGHLDPEIP